jgi:hypothetical protein
VSAREAIAVATASATDAPSGMASFGVSGASSEPPGHKEPDIEITGSGHDPRGIQLRAERGAPGQYDSSRPRVTTCSASRLGRVSRAAAS